MPIKMTEVMRRFLEQALEDGAPPLIGTATAGGDPQISPKGTLAVYDEGTLCFWERSYRTSYDAIVENPRVIVYCRNQARAKEVPFRNAALRFRGVARIASDEAARERVWNSVAAGRAGARSRTQGPRDLDPGSTGSKISPARSSCGAIKDRVEWIAL